MRNPETKIKQIYYLFHNSHNLDVLRLVRLVCCLFESSRCSVQQIVIKLYKILGFIWLLQQFSARHHVFTSAEEIVSSLGSLTETITTLLTFLTGCYLGVRNFIKTKGSTAPSAASKVFQVR